MLCVVCCSNGATNSVTATSKISTTAQLFNNIISNYVRGDMYSSSSSVSVSILKNVKAGNTVYLTGSNDYYTSRIVIGFGKE